MAKATRERIDLIMRCYGYQHAWDPYWPKDLPVPMTGFGAAARCLRCEAKRVFMLSWNGRTIGRRYWLPDDYREAIKEITRGEARIWLEQKHNTKRARWFVDNQPAEQAQ